MTTSDCAVIGTSRKYAAAVPTKIATPPSIAVGRLCQRSDFGLATKPRFTANVRTAKVEMTARIAATAPTKIGFATKSGKLKFFPSR